MTEPQRESIEKPVSGDETPAPAPMSPRLLARLFVVPLLIVIMIIACSLAVWLLFGRISESREESLEKLVARIEAGTGEKVLDAALLPKDREVWQAAMELARRLEGGDVEKLSEAERSTLATRLSTALERRATQRQGELGQDLQRFLFSAVGRLGRPEGVPILVRYAADAAQPRDVRRDAVAALIQMKQVPAARFAWPEIAGLLEAQEPVLRLYATMAVGALAAPGDEQAIKLLRRAYHSDDREVQWNAALALARLQDAAAVPLLREMLSRAYWQAVPVAIQDGGAPDPSRHLTPMQVDAYLRVTIEAAAALGSPILRDAVEALKSDPSPLVKEQAARAVASWPAGSTRPGSSPADR